MLIDVPDVGMPEVGFWETVREIRGTVDLAGKIVALKALFFKNLGPFFRFQTHSVGSCKAGPDETNMMDIATVATACHGTLLSN
jgi:hypothetical protein